MVKSVDHPWRPKYGNDAFYPISFSSVSLYGTPVSPSTESLSPTSSLSYPRKFDAFCNTRRETGRQGDRKPVRVGDIEETINFNVTEPVVGKGEDR